jgi:hypothetical protein
MDLSLHIIDFYKNLEAPSFLPEGVEAMDPYEDNVVMKNLGAFYSKYFSDKKPRVMLVGINPGRFGGGLTGIPFTDPINLQDTCGIQNNLVKRHELSSKFIYEMINELGGVEKFYKNFYITAVSPLGFVMNGKNLNYYDIPELTTKWESFIIKALKTQAEFCKNRTICYSLGQGKNFKFLQRINEVYQIFDDVRALPHPRWIMQYRLKRKDEFISVYERSLEEFLQ